MKEKQANQQEDTVISFYTFSAYANALQRFKALYQLEHLAMCPGESMVRELKPKRERQCRFCGLRKPDTSFDTRPHVIPEMLGNKYLISDYECDKCNLAFSSLESNLADFVGASRALYAVEGKKLPTFKSAGKEVTIRKEGFYGVQDGTKISSTGQDETVFAYNQDSGALEVKYLKNTYTPIKVYKALLKIALSIMPAEHIVHYSELLQLLQYDPDNRLARFASVFISRLPVQLLTAYPLSPRCHLNKRINPESKVCMHQVSFYFLDYVIELPLPLYSLDIASNLYTDKDFAIPVCPPLFFIDPDKTLFNISSVVEQSLAGTTPIKETEVITMQHAVNVLENTQVYNPTTGEMKPSDGILPDIVAIYISRSGELPNFPIGPFENIDNTVV